MPHTLAQVRNTNVKLSLLAALLFFIASGTLSYYNATLLKRNIQWVTHTFDVINALKNLRISVQAMETGQRGYLLTGNENYLEPYHTGLSHMDKELRAITELTADNPVQSQHIDELRQHIQAKREELETTITLRQNNDLQAAMGVVNSDRGKRAMEAIRDILETMFTEEISLRTTRIREMREAYTLVVASVMATAILGILLTFVISHLLARANKLRREQEWLQSIKAGLGNVLIGELNIQTVSDAIITFLANHMNAQAGALYVRDEGIYRRRALYGAPSESVMESFMPDERLLGRAVRDKRNFVLQDIPEGYLAYGSGFGQTAPRHIAIAPVTAEGVVIGVMELGFQKPVSALYTQALTESAEMIGMALRASLFREIQQNLLEETQRQAEELQAQSEELRVANEELEEQSRALQESQSRLEQQQAELEQTNAQLEEQTQQLEVQRDDLSKAQAALQLRSRELEQASQYKSDFLANMSHELRTPLNSSLILAKLLSDNPEGNLTDEQVRYAQTIQSSGNDLLMLINDILDLSKIEAGHMEIQPEDIPMAKMLDDLTRTFEPLAQQKKLKFSIKLAKGCPKAIYTDAKRLEQVLKNLLSNALKFTEKGEVQMTVSRTAKGVAFTVRDTGIGISSEQHEIIFEAFRQADGTTNRKYGGTGLGLSITRELTRLLGGDIELESEPGKGSTFTVTVPETYHPETVKPRAKKKSGAEPAPVKAISVTANPIVLPETKPSAKNSGTHPLRIPDDREKLAASKHVILVVEDDEPFARILYDLTHELDFQCLIAHTADEALSMALQYMPSAVILDVGLPDHSGLSVLDRLKRDPRTRHIPVHVISAGDYSERALSLGAVGYMLKPVKREELTDTLKQLEGRLVKRMRRVLVVEDDPVQLESLQKLLGSHDVETVGVGTAKDCLKRLKKETFDCMVLDLSLPDATGYSLLETLSQEEAYSFPPVIVYTGRDLSSREEEQLRRYSKSIIIKGAKSPERLLDEVTLFLHQVVADLPAEQQKMLKKARNRDALLEGRRILVVEDDIRNVYALTSIFEPRGAAVQIARNGLEAIEALERARKNPEVGAIDLVLMDVMMPEMDGITATREIRKHKQWQKLPIIMLTAKAMKGDQERCLDAGANDYMAKPLDVEKLLSLVRVWMPR